MIAHILSIAAIVIIVGGIFGLILWAHFADQRAFDRSGLDVCHKTCKSVDLLEEARRAEQHKATPGAAAALGKFLGELLLSAAIKRQAA
jgi:hypothetical protein